MHIKLVQMFLHHQSNINGQRVDNIFFLNNYTGLICKQTELLLDYCLAERTTAFFLPSTSCRAMVPGANISKLPPNLTRNDAHIPDDKVTLVLAECNTLV